MSEIHLTDLSPKSQKSRFGSILVGEANALLTNFNKKGVKVSPVVLEAHARSNVAHKAYEDRLRNEADVDSLTGLLSRRAILREVKAAMSKVKRQGGNIQVIVTDVRDFKWINDHAGHRAGDYALNLIATGLRGQVRAYDSVGRLGGDEYLILIPDGEAKAPDFIRERLHLSLGTANFPYNAMEIDFGVADYNPKQFAELGVSELIHRADQAMYFAKQNKLAKVARWNPSMMNLEIPDRNK